MDTEIPSREAVAVPLASMERLWAGIRAEKSDPRAGVFGPQSISWKINRESALFLGAGRAALLQLAHPWVAAALDHHSNLRNDPLRRFHNTFRIVFTMIFGTLDQALASSRYLYRLHTRIEGRLPETVGSYSRGTRYQANEVHALLWVYATLVESAVLAYECVQPALAPEEREGYYRESKIMAALFGIPGEALPSDWLAFQAYTGQMAASGALVANALSRDLADGVLRGKGSWVPVPQWYRALTASWLPERLRSEFGLDNLATLVPPGKDSSKPEAAVPRWLPHFYRRLPEPLRFVGPYREACARLRGQPSGPWVRACNRFWMGQPQTMFPELGA